MVLSEHLIVCTLTPYLLKMFIFLVMIIIVGQGLFSQGEGLCYSFYTGLVRILNFTDIMSIYTGMEGWEHGDL